MTSAKGSSLEAMFSGRHELLRRDGKIFIDRDPEMFKLLVQFLRNDRKFVELDSKHENELFKNELDYWNIETHDEVCHQKLQDIFDREPAAPD